MTLTEQQQQGIFRKHALERLELSAFQAYDWVEFYTEFGPPEMAAAWERTHQHRVNLFQNATKNDAATP